ncbi:FHA domain-containing protein [Massilia cavernae]|uniref:FHA domain-containing protein n=1 Tax=Massilia cavernae TaxID=2320864 RepID=A0A418XRS1_9BURK|nr:FHA domain-containing protein [Massilia cavernae]RJG15236.1 FHA domain-containing protein [Massilia cavernae]
MPKIIISHGDTVEQEVELTKPRMTIGRHPHNDIVIDHRAISGQHAAITFDGGVTQVEDLGSTNGTLVNGQRIARQTLADRDVITLALHTLSYVGTAAPPQAPAAPLKASVEVMNGPNAGKTLKLVKPLTTLGTPGVMVAVIGRQAERFFVDQVEGTAALLVNGLPTEQRELLDGDTIDLSGTQMKFSVTS